MSQDLKIIKSNVIEHITSQLTKKDFSGQAIKAMQESTTKVIGRIQQDIYAQIHDQSNPIIENFAKQITEKLENTVQEWYDKSTNNLTVLPEGARFIHKDGDIQTIIIEQPPQVRTISLSSIGNHKAGRYRLAFPYVQFILTLVDGRVYYFCVCMTKKPISNVKDHLYFAVLPNVGSDTKVCLGKYTYPTGTLIEITNEVIAQFWQSQFNENMAQEFLIFLENNNLSLKDWQKKSALNPLFVIEDNIKYNFANTIKDLFHNSTTSLTNQKSSKITEKLKSEISKAVKEINNNLNEIIGDVDFQTENREKSHVDILQEVYKDIIGQAYSQLWDFFSNKILEEQQRADKIKETMQAEMVKAANKIRADLMYSVDKTVW